MFRELAPITTPSLQYLDIEIRGARTELRESFFGGVVPEKL
jgi:hypothetical protein